jgi:tetratricopeptide (TPR) repeat protein
MMPVMLEIDRANAYIRNGKLDEALSVMRGAERTAPRDPRVLQILGKVLLYQEKDAEAEKVLRKSLEARPYAEVCVLLAQLLIKQKRFDEAVPVLDRCEALDPLQGGLWIARGDMAQSQGKFAEAIANYRKAKEVDPTRVSGAADERIRQVERLQKG